VNRAGAFLQRRVFIDTAAYFATLDPDDTNHSPAEAFTTRLAASSSHLFTTNFVAAETHALLLTRRNREVALRFLDALDLSGTTIVRVSAADERRSRSILRRFDDKAFTFDRNFAQYGFVVLPVAEL
jgi:predicted nucleic acid-binding protein